NLQLVRLFLKNSKIGLDTAANGPQAIDMTKKKKYDIIFLDRKMPGLDGLETFKKIREDSGNMNAKSVFILLTADEGDGIRENALREGFSDFLAKPFKPQMLEDIIKKHLP
ncbi:MAG: response regulator, partial [Lachnospiraceae bacterium]|nr:response regulator [Lachnospiraceae bacterium]